MRRIKFKDGKLIVVEEPLPAWRIALSVLTLAIASGLLVYIVLNFDELTKRTDTFRESDGCVLKFVNMVLNETSCPYINESGVELGYRLGMTMEEYGKLRESRNPYGDAQGSYHIPAFNITG